MNWITPYKVFNEETSTHKSDPNLMLLLLTALGIMLIGLTITNTPIVYSEDGSGGGDDVNKKSEDVNKKSEDVNKKSEDVNKKSEDVNKKSEDVNKANGEVVNKANGEVVNKANGEVVNKANGEVVNKKSGENEDVSSAAQINDKSFVNEKCDANDATFVKCNSKDEENGSVKNKSGIISDVPPERSTKNRIPIADDKHAETYQGKPVDIQLTASGADQNLKFSIKNDPTHGDLAPVNDNGGVTADNNVVTYTPKEDFVGEDSFSVQPDGLGPGGDGIISIKVTPASTSSHEVKADDKHAETYQGKPVDIQLTASGADQNLKFYIKKDPVHGDLAPVNDNGGVTDDNNVVTYTPKEDFVGEDSFPVKPDVLGPGGVGTISIKVVPSQKAAVTESPIADAGPDKEQKVGETATLDGSNSHAQTERGTIVGYQWTWHIPEDVKLCPESGQLSGEETNTAEFKVPVGSEGCSYTYDLLVTDSNGLTADDSVTVKVNPSKTDNPVATVLDLKLSQKVVEPSGTITISGTLLNDDLGTGVEGEKITLSGPGTTNPDIVTTNDGGSFSVDGRAPDKEGEWVVNAHFDGDGNSNYNSSSDEETYRTTVGILHIDAKNINIQHVANETEEVKNDHKVNGITLPIGVPKVKGCNITDFHTFEDRLREITIQDSDDLKYKVIDKGIPKTIKYTILYNCNDIESAKIADQFKLLFNIPIKPPLLKVPDKSQVG
jgi:hypothetical protein